MIASPDGKLAYVPIYGNSGVGKTRNRRPEDGCDRFGGAQSGRRSDFGHGVRPHCPRFGPKDGLLYVTTELDKTVSVIDPKTLKMVGTIPTEQPESHMLAISHDGRRGYTANVGPGTVSVLDMEGRKNLAIIPISKDDPAYLSLSGRQHGVHFRPNETATCGDRYLNQQGEDTGCRYRVPDTGRRRHRTADGWWWRYQRPTR